jgi:hypothetical protein
MVSLIPSGGGSLKGVPVPKIMSGTGIYPHYTFTFTSTPLTTTATRLYYVPIYLDNLTTFAGIKTYNSGAGDNGETYRVGIYNEATAGGPGSLLNDCGEITLTAAPGLRTAASSFTNTVTGWHYLAIHANSAFAIYAFVTAMGRAGSQPYDNTNEALPQFGMGSFAGGTNSSYPFLYVDTTYGALASTAVAPTASINSAPAMQVYV